MIIWLSLLTPVFASFLMIYLFHKKFVWWEIFLPLFTTSLIIFIFKFSVETSLVSDIEYNGSLIQKVVYFEPYETYVHRICTRSYKCGKSTCISTYDCSYCDYNGPEYKAYDLLNHTYTITKEHYERLIKEWNNNKFVDLNRNINYHWYCGKDGDSYVSYWDKTTQHSESNVWIKIYENKTKVNHSAFHFKEITDVEIKKYGLVEYPTHYSDSYKQQVLLGNFNNYISNDSLLKIERKFQYLNGELGMKKHVKLFIILFEDKNIDIAFKQECFWEGGNENEIVICLNVNSKTKKITWIKPFSWTPNKITLVELREEIMSIDQFNLDKIYDITYQTLEKYFKPRDFKEFNYLTVEPPLFEIIIAYILSLLTTIGVNIWSYNNKHENYEEN